ncbi:MAG: sigma 54-interacting transcriptional regulator [Planctomycetes bacterium]|nr:sigma 54-interacting transcriptional regulator [Planctomycetota bacterium]
MTAPQDVPMPGELPSPETRARRRDLALRTLTGVSHLMATLDFEETLIAIVRASLELAGAARGFLFLAGPDGSLSMRIGRTAAGAEIPTDRMPEVSTSFVNRAMRERRCIYVRDVAAEPTLAAQPSVVSLGLGSILCLPMVLTAERWRPGEKSGGPAAGVPGVIYLDRPGAGKPMTAEDFAHFQALGNLAAAALVNAEVHRDAITDSLTGLAHRRHFGRTLDAALEASRRDGRPVSLVMADLDGFKQVNDSRGHAAGDEVLKRAGLIIRSQTPAGGLAARYGGDEFAVILPGAASDAALRAASAMVDGVRAQLAASRVTLSAGVSTLEAGGRMSREDLLRRADAALYASKGAGRDRVTLWSPSLEGPAPRADELAGVFTGEPARDYRNMRLLLRLLLDGAAAEGATEDRLAQVLGRLREAVSAAAVTLHVAENGKPRRWLGDGPPEHDQAAGAAAGGSGSTAEGLWAAALRRDGALLGVLVASGPRAGGWPGPHDRALLEAMAPQVALLLAEGRLRDARRRADAEERDRLTDENERLAASMRRRGVLVGESARMKELFETVRRVAPSNATAFIIGETGTGKESLARTFHDLSRRSRGPYVVADCTTIPKDLVEGELFGHEKGAFTGAGESRAGLLEAAQGGTLFLDEVTELPAAAQSRLLRFLQEGESRRVGSTEPRKLDVRVVAATNRDPEVEVREGRLRPDLYYRLRVVTLRVPPLREREEDIVLLAEHLLARYARVERKRFAGFDEEAVKAMRAHAWPGNVRDLEHRIQRAVLFARGDRVTAEDLELAGGAAAPPGDNAGLRALVDAVEREAIEKALKQARGNVTHAADRLLLSRTTLQALMRRHGMSREAFGG